MFLLRAFAVLLVIIFAESVHGILRQMFLAPLVGDFTARRRAFFIAVLLIFAITWFFIRWIDAQSRKSLYLVGLMWMVLMAAFEFGVGRFVANYSWEKILEDYDISKGGLMGLGLLFLVFVPALASKLRGTDV